MVTWLILILFQVSGYDPTESDGYTPPSPGYHDNQQPSRHSSSSSLGNNNSQDSCVRASLQMTLLDDTITNTPRKRSDTRNTLTPQNSVSNEPSTPVTPPHSAKEKGFFPTSWPFRIESFSGARRQDNMNKERSYEQMQFRPRAGSFRHDDMNNVTLPSRCDNNVIPEKLTNSYEKYLQTLRLNRQRNDLVNRNFENRRHSCSDWQDHNVNCHVTNGTTSQHSTAV